MKSFVGGSFDTFIAQLSAKKKKNIFFLKRAIKMILKNISLLEKKRRDVT